MNERQLKNRKKERRNAYIVFAFILLVIILAWYFGLFDAIIPFKDK